MMETMILRITPTLRGITSKSQDFCAGPNLWEAQDARVATAKRSGHPEV